MKVEAYFTAYLRFFLTIIPGEVGLRSVAGRTCTLVRNVTFDSAKSRFDGFAIALFIVSDEVVPLPILFIGDDTWKLINLEFLVCRRL